MKNNYGNSPAGLFPRLVLDEGNEGKKAVTAGIKLIFGRFFYSEHLTSMGGADRSDKNTSDGKLFLEMLR